MHNPCNCCVKAGVPFILNQKRTDLTMNIFHHLDIEDTLNKVGYPDLQSSYSLEQLKKTLEVKANWKFTEFTERFSGSRKGAWERSATFTLRWALILDYVFSFSKDQVSAPYGAFQFLYHPELVQRSDEFSKIHTNILRLNNTGVYKALNITAVGMIALVFPRHDYELPDERKAEIVLDIDNIVNYMEESEEFLSTHILQMGDYKPSVPPLPY